MKTVLKKQAKRAFAIGMAAIGVGLTGCSVLPAFPDHIQRWDDGEKRTTYAYEDYVLFKDEFKEYPVSCEAYYYRNQTDLKGSLKLLKHVISRHEVQYNCGKFGFVPDSDFVREHDLYFSFEKNASGIKCGINVGNDAPSSAPEAQLWVEMAEDILPSCSDVFIFSENTKKSPSIKEGE